MFCIQAAKHILQGPTSALEGPGSHRGKQGNAAICGITALTPNLIAYIATQVSFSCRNQGVAKLIVSPAFQVRFALSSTSSWAVKDGTFSYQDFYHHIVELLTEDDDETSQIINLYNQ